MKEDKRTYEITASISAVIPTGSYENFKPLYSIKETIATGGDGLLLVSERADAIRDVLYSKLALDYARLRIERIKQQRKDIRFYQRGNRQYPSVTSIISAIEPITYDPVKLQQYASRGKLVHAQINWFFQTGAWEKDVLKIPGTKLDYLIVTQGALKLKWDDCNFPGFWDEVKKDVQGGSISSETTVFNDEYEYAGTRDLKFVYNAKNTVADVKTASTYDNDKLSKYFRQMAAYAKCEEGIEQMMLIPLNPRNKTGYGKPVIETDIDRYFTAFLQDRAAFKEVYGV